MPASITNFLKTQTDYLVFVGVSILVFVLIALALRRWRRAQLSMPVWVLVGAILVGGWWSVQRAGENAREDIQRLVSALAPTYAMELGRMGHEKITLDTKADDPLYLEQIDLLKKWAALNPAVADIYTMRKRPDGKIMLIVDAETDYNHDGKFEGEREKRTPIGEEYDENSPGLALALKGKTNFDADIVPDRWGEWVSAWSPIYDSNGKIDGVVGVDFDAHEWLAAIADDRRNAILAIALILTFVALGGTALAMLNADLAERTAAEERYRKADERMQITIRQMPVAFIEWDTQARAKAWNPAAERIFGFTAGEMVGKQTFAAIVSPAARAQADKVWSELLANTGGTHSINDNLTKDGRTVVCEWFNTPLVGLDGKVVGVFSLAQDLTERLNLEKHVQQSQRLNAVGQLAAGVAHDFNNILTIITGHAGLLLGQSNIPADARPDLEHIESAALRASSLTRQLLAFSRQQAMFPRSIHLYEVVKNTATMLARTIGSDITFKVRFGESLLPIEADSAMIEQVITNLVLNARDAMPRGGTLTIAIDRVEIFDDAAQRTPDARPGTAVCLSVTDTGMGIAAEHLPHLFEPFFSTKKSGEGTGLGLSVVHGIVKQHHGWIEVESVVGKGTAFRVYFPPTNKQPEIDLSRRAPAGAASDAPAKRKTVLLVEDEEMVRKLASTILQRHGYEVLEAKDGPHALEVWTGRKDEVDLLLTDMIMPNGITGGELAHLLLHDRPGLPVIYASGYSMELTAPDFLETDKQAFLQKPYRSEQLVATVQHCIN